MSGQSAVANRWVQSTDMWVNIAALGEPVVPMVIC